MLGQLGGDGQGENSNRGFNVKGKTRNNDCTDDEV